MFTYFHGWINTSSSSSCSSLCQICDICIFLNRRCATRSSKLERVTAGPLSHYGTCIDDFVRSRSQHEGLRLQTLECSLQGQNAHPLEYCYKLIYLFLSLLPWHFIWAFSWSYSNAKNSTPQVTQSLHLAFGITSVGFAFGPVLHTSNHHHSVKRR